MACTVDFRCLDEGFGGKTYKRKRAEKEQGNGIEAMEVEEIPRKRQAVPSEEDPNKPVLGRPTYDGVIAGRVSGRNWKQPRKHRSSAAKVSVKGKSLEQRMKEKEIKKAYKERINELKEVIRHNKVEKRKQREEREKKKQENILKSGTKVQKITNPKTLKKIAKSKQRKLLKDSSKPQIHSEKNKSNPNNKIRSNNEEKEHNRTLPFCVTRIDSETIDVNNVAHGKC
uniref:Coiled-coil domain-containing protein 86 n=1 Tax=Solanum lycopersicum TaxID=4081 RepID=A0A3Q7FEE0_SOLLC